MTIHPINHATVVAAFMLAITGHLGTVCAEIRISGATVQIINAVSYTHLTLPTILRV